MILKWNSKSTIMKKIQPYRVLFVLLLFCCSLQIQAQNASKEFNISGTVTDENNQPMSGVGILIKGTSKGTTSNAEGSFKIVVPNKDVALIFSFVGYITQEVAVGNKNQLNVQLTPNAQELNEVQVVAFGEQRTRDVTGSISTIKTQQIRSNAAMSPDVAFQGRVTGAQITQSGGSPGGAVRINIRGVASINSNSQPLVVIDGVPVINSAYGSGGIAMNPLSQINPDDIESMEILKDASSSILYGSRAANGVILITTKKGVKGKTKFDFSYQEGVNTATNRVDFLGNGADYLSTLKRAAANNINAGLNPVVPNLVNLLPAGILKGSSAAIPNDILVDSTTLYNTNTDWLSQTLRQARFRQASLGVSAGVGKLLLFASGSYRTEDGIVVGQSLDRLSGRINLSLDISKNLKFGANFSVSSLNNTTIPLSVSFQMPLTNGLGAYPIQLPNGDYFNGINQGNNQINVGSNPVFYRQFYSNATNTFRSTNTAFIDFSPVKGLFIRTEWGYDVQNNKNDILQKPEIFPTNINGREKNGNGRAENRTAFSSTVNVNNIVSYKKEINAKHRFTVLVGNSIQTQNNESDTYITENVTAGNIRGADTTRTVIVRDNPVFRFVSYFGRINYALKDKYLLEASFRTDGSSRFGPGKRWATFPGLSAGWIISEESFLKNSQVVNFLKLRASYGATGNAEIGNFSWQKSFTYVGYNAAIYGGLQGGQFTNPGNSDLSWETTTQFDLGLEYRLANNRIKGSIDFYNKDSKDLLLEYSLGPLFGTINNVMTINLGTVRNRGVEFSISSQNIETKNFSWSTDFNISHNKNEVLSTYTAPFLNYEYQFVSGTSIAAPGYPLGTYYLTQFAGFDPNNGNELFYERDRTAFAVAGRTQKTGNVWDGTVNNQSGNNQFIIDGKTPYPVFFGGFNNTFRFKNIELSALLYYQYGNWIYDQGERVQSYPNQGQVLRASTPGIGSIKDETGKTDPTTPYRLQWQSNARSFESSRFLHDGSFIRLKNVQLSYNIPNAVTKKWHLNNVRIFVIGQNLWTLTKFKGWDPEVFRSGGTASQGEANLQPGVTNNDLPQVKSFIGGLSLSF